MKQNLFGAAVIMLLSSFIVPLNKINIRSVFSYFEYTFAALSTDGTPDINLEKSSAVYPAQKNRTATPVLTINGAKSAVRLKKGVFEFLAHHINDGTATLTSGIGLYKLNADKKNRSLTLDPAAWVVSSEHVILTFVQKDEQTIKIIVSNGTLSTGEYAFVEGDKVAANTNLTVWCFGID